MIASCSAAGAEAGEQAYLPATQFPTPTPGLSMHACNSLVQCDKSGTFKEGQQVWVFGYDLGHELHLVGVCGPNDSILQDGLICPTR